jgi:hypothetical protein
MKYKFNQMQQTTTKDVAYPFYRKEKYGNGYKYWLFNQHHVILFYLKEDDDNYLGYDTAIRSVSINDNEVIEYYNLKNDIEESNFEEMFNYFKILPQTKGDMNIYEEKVLELELPFYFKCDNNEIIAYLHYYFYQQIYYLEMFTINKDSKRDALYKMNSNAFEQELDIIRSNLRNNADYKIITKEEFADFKNEFQKG